MIEPLWLADVNKVNEMDGMVYVDTVPNISADDGAFLIDQRYFFPVNDPKDDSVTVVRMVIPAGTDWREGYAEIRDSLTFMGLVPSEVAELLEVPEIMAE